ncbi:MAG: histidine phosphatase family protein [Anaerolineae bacterium]|jgi:broad specificity phosphatase PhoE|nr:histidine phosphatase family protein [Anaerolineae bacterium]
MTNRIYLVRHGENIANLTKEFSHRLVDHPLTERGILQAQQTAQALVGRGIQAIFSSPLRRSSQTAQIIAARLELPIAIIEDFREANIGDLEKQPPSAETWAQHNAIVDSWFHGHPENAFPGGENYHGLTARYFNALRQVMAGHEGQTLLVVGHGGMFSWALPALCPDVDLRWLRQQTNHNCAITEVAVQAVDGRVSGELIAWANIDHLNGEAANFANPIGTDADFDRSG